MGFIIKTIASLLALIAFLFFSSNAIKIHEKEPKYVTYVYEITNQFIKEMKREHGMICVGEGGSMPLDVEKISLSMSSFQYATIDQAAQLEILATEKLKNLVNSHLSIRPFLREYPFTTERARISVSFRDSESGSQLNGSAVGRVSQIKNQIIYYYYDASKLQHVEIHREPYEEAKKRLFPNGI